MMKMDKLTQACALSNKEWADVLPKDIPDYSFSKAHNKKMQKLIRRMHGDKYRSTSKNTLRIILVAAVIVSLSVVAFSITATPKREYCLEHYSDHSEYTIKDFSGFKIVTDFSVGYIPEGFELIDSFECENSFDFEYKKKGSDYEIALSKEVLPGIWLFDNEHADCKTIKDKGIDYIVFQNKDNDYFYMIWNTNGYVYTLDGNVDLETALKIAQNMK